MGDHKQSQQQQPSWPPRSSNREPALERRSWRRSQPCLARSSRTSSRSTGGPFLSSRLDRPPTRPTWTNWTSGCAASRPPALTSGLSSKNDVGFGINRLRIGCIIKDDEVDWEDVRDLMLANKNLVQSVDLYGIHKSKIV